MAYLFAVPQAHERQWRAARQELEAELQTEKTTLHMAARRRAMEVEEEALSSITETEETCEIGIAQSQRAAEKLLRECVELLRDGEAAAMGRAQPQQAARALERAVQMHQHVLHAQRNALAVKLPLLAPGGPLRELRELRSLRVQSEAAIMRTREECSQHVARCQRIAQQESQEILQQVLCGSVCACVCACICACVCA